MATKKAKEKVRKIPPITIEDAKLIFKNFSGAKKKFNPGGLRNFNVVLDPEVAQMLERDGWNIKWDDPKEEGDLPRARIKVAVRFDNFPPRIVLVDPLGGKTVLDEDTVEILDWAEITTADLVLSGSRWEVNDKTGIKAYLLKGFFVLSEDDLEAKYSGGAFSGKKSDKLSFLPKTDEEDED